MLDRRILLLLGLLVVLLLIMLAFASLLGNDEPQTPNPYANDASQGGDQLNDQDNSTAGADLLNSKNATTSSLGNESSRPEPPKIILR